MNAIYIHVPFCPKKCPYCDFYSLAYSSDLASQFTKETIRRLESTHDIIDTLYFGGGTPSLLGSEKINEIISAVNLSSSAEVTLESNPNIVFTNWQNTKINRLSLGVQSVNESELKFLGRTHNAEKAKKCIESAKKAGISNISLDLMIGLPEMTLSSLLKSIDFCEEQGVNHVSSYILKVEEGTPFHEKNLNLPEDERISEQYLFMTKELEKRGFIQYEISNFCKKGFESRHNLKYWNCENYLGLGAGAHSFLDGKRAYFPRDLDYYLCGNEAIFDSDGGDIEEFLMLKLRLKKGISKSDCDKFSATLFSELKKQAQKIPSHLMKCEGDSINLTKEGFLLSNPITLKLLEIL